jgi:hypothetical protein
MTNKILLIHGLFTKRFVVYKKDKGEMCVSYEERSVPTFYKNPYGFRSSLVWKIKDFLKEIIV